MKRAGAVIVTFNSAAEIGPCLDAALAHLENIVVVDNASHDRTREEVLRRPAVRWLPNSSNRGFAAAVNQGIQALDTPFVLLLNPDAELLTGISPLLEACSQPGVAAAAGKLVDGHNRPQVGFSVRRLPTGLSLGFEVLGLNRLWPGNPVNRRFRCRDLNHDAPAEVEQPAGAFLMIRREAWRAVGGFDEGFHPLWFEDVDFLKRLRDGGHRVVYVPSVVARHKGGQSVGKISCESQVIYWYASLLRYTLKHFGPAERRAICAATIVGSVPRMLMQVVLTRSLEPVRAYGRVIRLAWLRLMSSGVGRAGGSPVMARR